jgi:hypothetical protein
MSAPNMESTMRQSARDEARRELTQKEWRRPVLRKLPIAETAHTMGKTAGLQDDGMGGKNGDIRNLS